MTVKYLALQKNSDVKLTPKQLLELLITDMDTHFKEYDMAFVILGREDEDKTYIAYQETGFTYWTAMGCLEDVKMNLFLTQKFNETD